MFETVRCTYRLRSGAQAERALITEWGRRRWLWNEAVSQHKAGRRPTLGKLPELLTAARAASQWLRDGSQVAQQHTLRTYMGALDHSFTVRGRRQPGLKRRKDTRPSLEYITRGFRIRDRRLLLPNGVSVPVIWSRGLPSQPSSVRIYQDSLGHWYASFAVTRDLVPAPPADGGIGTDWGVTVTAMATGPAYDLPYGGRRKSCAAELARAQRRMSRRRRQRGQAPSNRYRRARREAARGHKKAARQNTHAARVWARRVVDSHQVIAVKDFRPLFLARSAMARKSADAAISAAKRELIDRGKRAGRKVVLVPPAYRTMTCAQCGTGATERLTLADRVFVCAACGCIADRDRNAARVILAMAERGHAGADDIRHPSRLPSGVAGGMRSEPQIPQHSAIGKR